MQSIRQNQLKASYKSILFIIPFYIILYFGIVSMLGKYNTDDEYSILEMTSAIILFIVLLLILFNKKTKISTYILFIFLIGANFHFGNFLINTIFPPTIPALNCGGALPMNGNWIRGIFFCLLTSPFLFFATTKPWAKLFYSRGYSLVLDFSY